MKTFLAILLFSTFSWHVTSQEFHLRINGQTKEETKTVDSLQYNTKHKNVKSITDEIKTLSATLYQMGYIDNVASQATKTTDSIYEVTISLGNKVKSIHLYIGADNILNKLLPIVQKNNEITLPYTELDSFLTKSVQILEEQGFALAKIKLINIERKDNDLYADLKIETEQKRKLNSITIQYLEDSRFLKFPKGHLKQINKKYQNSIFNQKTVESIYNDFQKYNFVHQSRYPEILFTKDNTNVYVYLEKRNSNSFDGFLGFSNNDDKKITLTGYLDVTLENILRTGEEVSLYWKSDGNDQKSFKGSLELPYLFKTPIGLKAQLNIFRQDSTFQNTKTALDLSYYMNYNSRLYLGYHATQSSDIQNSNNTLVSDYNNSFITSRFEYTSTDPENLLFPIQSKFQSSLGLGSRGIINSMDNSKNKQLIVNINAIHNFYFNKKNSLYFNSQNNYLQSDRYITNELFRFGGFNSIRGFNENSLQAYFSSTLLTEYRYLLSTNLYLHSILDYSIFRNKSDTERVDISENLIGIGAGFGLQTKNGVLKLAIANGRSKKQQFEISNTIIHISYNVKF